jgi:hypothetical protein
VVRKALNRSGIGRSCVRAARFAGAAKGGLRPARTLPEPCQPTYRQKKETALQRSLCVPKPACSKALARDIAARARLTGP